jgi:hypothetical protein
MPDVRREQRFISACDLARDAVVEYAMEGVGDAKALLRRAFGENNLQAHWHSMFPVAIYFAIHNFDILDDIKENTDLGHEMTTGSPEASNTELWDPVANQFQQFVNGNRGNDIVSEGMDDPTDERSVQDVAENFMSGTWAGGQAGGGAGDTVVKRTLKLLSHLLV